MSGKSIEVSGRKVFVLETGSGAPLVYMHGWADVHSVTADLLPFHHFLAEHHHVLAPAHPGINGTDDLADRWSIDDVVFHWLEVFDALGLETFDLVGHSFGGWVAAEIAVRHPEKVRRLGLIDALGLFIEGAPIADVFMHAQPERGVDYKTLRGVLFATETTAAGLEHFPDGRGDIDTEVRRYQMLRTGSFVGFKPPYFYNRPLRDRLYRAKMPASIVWGEHDRFVGRSHGETYAKGLGRGAAQLTIIKDAGHSATMEQPRATADALRPLLEDNT